MRVLVTGGSGYVGAQTVRRLARDGTSVVVVDRVPPPLALRPSIERFVEGDIRTPGLLDRIFVDHDIDAVIHLAADKSVEQSVRDPGRYFDNNVHGTLTLVEAMHRAAYPVDHLLVDLRGLRDAPEHARDRSEPSRTGKSVRREQADG